jgi:hypothetical protein
MVDVYVEADMGVHYRYEDAPFADALKVSAQSLSTLFDPNTCPCQRLRQPGGQEPLLLGRRSRPFWRGGNSAGS